ncbi:DUF1353 domain-containing protein [Brevundimonas sp. 2R-24]|uniref:DUF1353 domain-containing protein n=1 Tax=Peiella sedimenti TaxID=3061083 RepID=A0ABT8SJB8_9CAUL|nr:DUF1353 domain-containing protein [Caulobacteraceae bacterium XZ-24]
MADRFGVFSGEPLAQWLTAPSGGRMMKLLEAFTFTEARTGRLWSAPAGFVVDGASIPRALWSIVGSPYTGNYRRASIVHDKACVDFPTDGPERKAADVMFQAACRAGGCGAFQASILYAGVRIGSSWAKEKGLTQRDEANEVWLETPPEDRELQERFRALGRDLQVQEKRFVEDDPEAAVQRVDDALTRHGFG